MKLLAIDPGTTGKNLGFARFVGGYLIDAGEGSLATLMPRIPGVDVIVFEMPQFYRPKESKGDPNKLAKLVKQIGVIQGIALCNGCTTFHEYLPAQWKGQLPKDVCARRAREVLTAQDAQIHGKDNAWDAVALGLWHLGRLKMR